MLSVKLADGAQEAEAQAAPAAGPPLVVREDGQRRRLARGEQRGEQGHRASVHHRRERLDWVGGRRAIRLHFVRDDLHELLVKILRACGIDVLLAVGLRLRAHRAG